MATSAKNKPTASEQSSEQPGAEKAPFEVVSRLSHNGEDYPVGSTVFLTAAEADPLLGHTVKEAA